MRFSNVAAIAAVSSLAEAQRPTNTSICDYYTTALLKNNTAANQYTILTLLVNTAVIGNYTKPNIAGVTFPDIAVTGILNNGTINGTKVSLLEYFNGALASTNRGGSSGVSLSFLDGGGAAPLMMNMPANDTTSNQYKLLTHLYQFFGTGLGCSQQGMTAFPSYQGSNSMGSVHKYMALDYAQNSYFIQQVGLSAASFGVAQSDINIVANYLDNAFNVRCAAAAPIATGATPELQSICITSDCPLAANNTCSAYPAVVQPSAANGTSSTNSTSGSGSTSSMTGTMTGTSTSTATTSGSSTSATGAAVKNAAGGMAVAAVAAAAFFL